MYPQINYYKTWHQFKAGVKLDLPKATTKWTPVFQGQAGLKNCSPLMEWFVTVAEIYSQFQEQMLQYQHPSFNTQVPSGFVRLEVIIRSLLDKMEVLIQTDRSLKPTIIRRYYNLITHQEGYELEGGICVEGGQTLVVNNLEPYLDRILRGLDQELAEILDPQLKRRFLRQNKLTRILK